MRLVFATSVVSTVVTSCGMEDVMVPFWRYPTRTTIYRPAWRSYVAPCSGNITVANAATARCTSWLASSRPAPCFQFSQPIAKLFLCNMLTSVSSSPAIGVVSWTLLLNLCTRRCLAIIFSLLLVAQHLSAKVLVIRHPFQLMDVKPSLNLSLTVPGARTQRTCMIAQIAVCLLVLARSMPFACAPSGCSIGLAVYTKTTRKGRQNR